MRQSKWLGAVVVALVGCGPAPTGGKTQMVATSVCPSGVKWIGGKSESPEMNPGQACISCHTTERGPALVIAGTVFSTLSQADDCNGLAGVKVQITDANQKVTTLTSNAAGNFYLETKTGTIATPYTAKIITSSGGERPMVSPQSSGDCNTCHTEKGSGGAPGRIAPF